MTSIQPVAQPAAPESLDGQRLSTRWITLHVISKMCGILALAALSMEVSELCLSPVYGSMLSKSPATWGMVPYIWATNHFLGKRISTSLTGLFSLAGITLTAIQPYILGFSGNLGPAWGPLLSFLLGPLIISYLSLLHVVDRAGILLPNNDGLKKETIGFRSNLRAALLLLLTCISYLTFLLIRKISRTALQYFIMIRSNAVLSRSGFQAILIFLYAFYEHSRPRIFAIVLPSLYFAIVNPHMPAKYNTAALNATLQTENFSLVARQESLTGYISVLDSTKDGFRAMRCDHSLLGGEWTNRPVGHPSKLNEPIYAIFVMLEAVRLVETNSVEGASIARDNGKSALVM